MAKYSTFNPGYDPTEDATAISRAQLLQMVKEAEHEDFIGPVLHSATAPNVVTYPKLKYFFWHKLNADLTGTGELYWYDTSVADWSPLEIPLGTLSGANFADGSITLAKLGGTGLSPGYLVRVNSAGTGYEAVSLDTVIAAGTLALNKLVNAAGTDYMIVSGAGGVWSAVDVITYIGDLLTTASLVSHRSIYDGDNSGSQYQVLGRGSGANAGVTWAYIESLLRANQTPTSKLQYAAGLAGKIVRVNSSGSDIEGVSAVNAAAVLKYTGVTNTAAQAVTGGAEATVSWNNETDPSSIVGLASSQVTLLTGTYLFEIKVPVHNPVAAAEPYIQVLLRDVTAANAIIATATGRFNGGSNTGDNNGEITLKHLVTITGASNVYDVRIYSNENLALGQPANLGSYAETYQQMTILKLS